MISTMNAANAYSSARSAITPLQDRASGDHIDLGTAAQEFAEQMQQFDTAATGTLTGSTDTHELVQAIAQSQLAMETVVAVRNKVVEAYQEILRMPV